jgi:hypothetical protein
LKALGHSPNFRSGSGGRIRLFNQAEDAADPFCRGGVEVWNFGPELSGGCVPSVFIAPLVLAASFPIDVVEDAIRVRPKAHNLVLVSTAGK